MAPEIDAAAMERGLTKAEWPARLQRLTRGALVSRAPDGAELWLDGAHNEAGGRVLAEAMAEFEEKAPRPLVLICGSLATKDTGAFLAHFSGLARELLAAEDVQAVEIHDGVLTVRTGDYGALTRAVGPAAQRAGASLLELRPADFNPDFLRGFAPRIDWPALTSAARQVRVRARRRTRC